MTKSVAPKPLGLVTALSLASRAAKQRAAHPGGSAPSPSGLATTAPADDPKRRRRRSAARSVVGPAVAITLLVAAALSPDTADAARTIAACRATVVGAAETLLAKRLNTLDRCTSKVLKCLAAPRVDVDCLPRAGARCTTQLAALLGARVKAVAKITAKCGPTIAPADLFTGDGLEYARIAARCADAGVALIDSKSLGECLALEAARTAERLFALPVPRARELLSLAGVDTSNLDLPALPGSGSLSAPARKALVKCSAVLAKASARFAGAGLEAVTDCVAAASSCVDAGLPKKCVDQTRNACNKAAARFVGSRGKRAALDTAVARACAGVPFDVLQSEEGVNVDALACDCAGVGIESVASLDAYRQCLQRQQECRVADLLRTALPTGEADLALVDPARPSLSTLLCPAPAAAGTARAPSSVAPFQRFVRSVLRPSVFGRALVKTGAPQGRPGAPATIAGVNRKPAIRPGGFGKTLVKIPVFGGRSRAPTADPGDALVVRVRRTDGAFADGFAELPLADADEDVELVVQYEPSLANCAFDLAFATRVDSELGEFAAATQRPEARLGGAPALARDINRVAAGDGPSALGAVGDRVFFAADDGVAGAELWTSDGTEDGTRRVADLRPGPEGSAIALVTGVGDRAFFAASNGAPGGTGLWTSDGTAAGTTLLAPFSFVGPFAHPFGGTLLFFADDGISGRELWRSDGTPATTVRVKDLDPNGNGIPTNVPSGYRPIVVGGLLYFFGNDGSGVDLWRSDGTGAGTVPVSALAIDPFAGTFLGLGTMGGAIYYSLAEDTRFRVFRTDGTIAGTTAVFDGTRTFGTGAVVGTDDRIFFVADDGDAPALWSSDGTAAGTGVIAAAAARNLTAAATRLFFTVQAPGSMALWSSDGTPQGTAALAGGAFPSIAGLVARGDEILFGTAGAPDSQASREDLRKSDGATVSLVANVGGRGLNGYNLTPLGDVLYFTGVDAAAGPELWRTDGTPAGTVRVADVDPTTAAAVAAPLEAADVAGTLFFAANDGASGRELWRSNGAADGTARVADINPGAADSAPSAFAALGGKAVFFADDGTHGLEPWISDGTETGTALLKDIEPGGPDAVVAAAGAPAVVNGLALFPTTRGLWRSDGTTAGTQPVAETVDAEVDRGRGVTGGALVFVASDDVNGREPWRSDGSPAGTHPLGDLRPGPIGSDPVVIAAGGGLVFFTADDGTKGRELWKTDGTEAGTAMVADLRTDAASGLAASATSAAVLGSVLYFPADDGSGPALWRSDGTALGTQKLRPFPTATLTAFAAAASQIFFVAVDGNARVLWRSDGTLAGTVALGSDVAFAPLDARTLTPFGNGVLFPALAPATGLEVWQSDGTPAGTRPVDDVNPGVANAGPKAPYRITPSGGLAFFPADDSTTGLELWSVPPEL